MSKRRFAFLRAINVGGRTVLKDRLVAAFESAGLANVETFLASGNVIFDAPPRATMKGLERKIEAALLETLGLKSATFARTGEELVAVAACAAFDAEELAIAEAGGAINVSFFGEAPDAASRERIVALGDGDNLLRFAGRELYWVSRTKMSQSPLFDVSFEKLAGLPATMRNINTVRRLVARYVDAN